MSVPRYDGGCGLTSGRATAVAAATRMGQKKGEKQIKVGRRDGLYDGMGIFESCVTVVDFVLQGNNHQILGFGVFPISGVEEA